MSTEEVRQEIDRQILRDLVTSAPPPQEGNPPVQEILKCYDYDTDSSEISLAMNKFYKTDLLVAAGYLNNLPKTFKLKGDLVNAIIRRIDNLLQEECPKCNTWYSVSKDEDPTVSCYLCGQGCHEACYIELGPLIERFPGLKYMCKRCENSTEKLPEKADNQRLPKAPQEPPAPPNTPPRDESPERNQFEDQPICQLLRRRECPYGVSGKTPVNGQICNFRHPKRCQPYCKYSNDPEQGCTKGRDCNLLHPILCKFAVRSKLCTNRQCKFTHPVGTKRYRPKRQEDQEQLQRPERNQERPERKQEKMERQEKSHQEENDSSRKATESNSSNQVPEKNYFNSNQIEASFLVQMSNQMKEMQREMREMKEMYKRPPSPTHLPWYQNPFLLNNQLSPQTSHPSLMNNLQNLSQNLQLLPPKVQQISQQSMLQQPTSQM